MALFDKLFSLKRRLDSDNREPTDRGRSCQINPEQVRLLLFKECDWRGRRLLFDSSAIQKVPAGKHDKPTIRKTDEAPCIVEVSDGYTYMYKGPEADASVLGEMIFGAVAMNCKSVSLKIHIMEEPRRLMCTKVFCVPVSRRFSRAERRTSDRLESSAGIASKPLSVPSLREEGMSLSFSMDRGDSGFCGDNSPYSSVGSTYDYFSMFETWDGNTSQEDFYSFHSLPGRKLSTSSNGSWQRRTFQNLATRFDLGHSPSTLNLPGNNTNSDSQMYSGSSTSGTSDSLASAAPPHRKNKLGLAVLITVTDSAEMDVVRHCVEHSPQLQALVCRLRLAAMAAGAGASFVSTLHRAKEHAAGWLSDLVYGPRLQPMWLSLVTQEPRVSHKLADSLLADLCFVLAAGDTKTTHFFISTLLTHVLTYHLGWVTTVSPYDTIESHPAQQARPYNALWAQLTDLCGNVGFPPRAARTILSGDKNTQFINRLLLVLTYFVRCGDVTKHTYKHQDCAVQEVRTVSVERTNECSDSASTLVASDSGFKRSTTLANLSQKLSSSDMGCSSGEKAIRRNPTMMHSLKASSDSSLYSTTSDESLPEQKVLFLLGDDEKLIGLKNKSSNGKRVKKSSKAKEPEETGCVRSCERSRTPDSPTKCCNQTLQHSKPIKHSGFKFEFDKYPQIVTNYMKSKNLEILDRHYIGKPGNLKLDNFQFDPTVVLPIQEERCEACVKCQMESMLQTPTNASEMEYMNDIPRAVEPQYAELRITEREMSPKTFVRKRKMNTVVVNLVNKSVSDSDVRTEPGNRCDRLAASMTDVCTNVLCIQPKNIPIIRTQDDTTDIPLSTLRPNKSFRNLTTKLKPTKSMGNLSSLISLDELDDENVSKSDSNISTNVLGNNEINSEILELSPISSNESIASISSRVNTNFSNQFKYAVSSEESTTLSNNQATISSDEVNFNISELSTRHDPKSKSSNDSIKLASSSKLHSSNAAGDLIADSLTKMSPENTFEPTLLELKKPEQRRIIKQERTAEVKRVVEFPLPRMCAIEDPCQRSGFDGSLLGGVTDHYVPDLILQGTLSKPIVWEAELRRDLDVTSYLSKTLDAQTQAVAIIGDTNTWEVRVVGRDCGTSGMSSLVGSMLDALPAMWKAKVPAHQCLSFLESKLREFCVLSKTLADLLMSTDFCDIATLTKSLNIDVNDVPLLLAVATTHTPQVATRYGLSYR